MKINEFDTSVKTLEEKILSAISEHFANFGVKFDREQFLKGTSMDARQLSMDAHMFGSNIYAD